VTTGAGNDIERATDMARKMVCEWGMSELGPLSFGKREEQIFLGREIAQHRDYSEATAVKIDAEVQKLVKRGYDSAKDLLGANRDVLVRIAMALIEREVLDAAQIKMIIEGQELPKIVPPPKADDGGIQQVIKPDLQPGRAKGGERPAPA
jgi:cell division protease FtsH